MYSSSTTPTSSKSSSQKRKYLMDYIEDRDLYMAVMFARKMIRSRRLWAPLAIRKAARFYRVNTSDVAHYVGQVGGTVAGRKRDQ